MALDYLPKKVCVLDLETSKLVRRPAKPPLAFVGTLIYDLSGRRYHPGVHRCFFPDELGELEKLLRSFKGIVLGHNILRFDYDEVLRSQISLEGVVEKTVDTLTFLHEKRSTEPLELGGTDNSLQGLSLDNLAQRNLGRSKTISGRSIPKMWREGRREEVITYNKEDLALTFSLWWWMVTGCTVVLGKRVDFNPYGGGTVGDRVYESWRVEIFPEDRPRLTGAKPLFNTREVLIIDGPELDEPPPDAWEEPINPYWCKGTRGRHYIHEDVLMITSPIHAFGGYFDAGPYPASWFTFRVEREGPSFPERSGGEALDLFEM